MINLKNLNFFVPYEHFKMESLNSLRFLFKKGDYIAKLDLSYVYFFVPLQRNLENLFDFNGMGNFIRVPLPLFWPRSCTTNVQESASSSIEKVEYADQNLHRHNNRLNQKGGGVNQEHSHLPFATF